MEKYWKIEAYRNNQMRHVGTKSSKKPEYAIQFSTLRFHLIFIRIEKRMTLHRVSQNHFGVCVKAGFTFRRIHICL